jgi:hypothetical protein
VICVRRLLPSKFYADEKQKIGRSGYSNADADRYILRTGLKLLHRLDVHVNVKHRAVSFQGTAMVPG